MLCFTSLLEKIMQNPEKTPKWICQGLTYLYAKNNNTRPEKLLTDHLSFNNLQTSDVSSDR